MKKLLSIIALIFLFTASLFSQNKALTIFDTSDQLNPHERGQAFAHWFVDQHYTDFSKAYEECAALDIPLLEMMKALKKNGKEGEFPEFVKEMEYYGKQDSIPLAQLEKVLLAFNYKVRNAWEKKLTESNQSLWIVYTPSKQDFILKGKDLRKGIKITSAVLGSGKNLSYDKKGPWFKGADKFNTKPFSPSEISQHFVRKDSSLVDFNFTLSTGEKWTCQIPAINSPAPYIKTFYSNFTKIDENQRIALTWEVWGVENVMINSNIGQQLPAWQIMLAPESDIEYTLTATNASGTLTKTVSIDVNRTYLTKATITYYQHKDSDPKEKGTTVVGELENIRGEIVGSSRKAQELVFPNDGNYYGPFEIQFSPDSILKKEMIHGKVHISMADQGKNTWSFTPIIVLTFSDGTSTKLLGEGLKELKTSSEKATINF